MNAHRAGIRLGLTLAAGLAVLLPASARAQNLQNGGGRWLVGNSYGTTNGQPTGGSAGGAGFGINDAYNLATSQSDAFDNGLLLFLNNHVLSAPAYTATATSASSGVVSLQGLNVTMDFQALASSPTLRTFITLTNPNASAVDVTASWVTNVGSDGGTQIIATGSGDQTFTTADRYVVTDDAQTTAGDPTNTFVLFGAGAAVTPTSVSRTVFSSAGTEGILANFSLHIPGGATQSLLFFNQIYGKASDAVAAVAAFNSTPSGELVSGLSQGQLSSVVNFQLSPTSSVPEPSSLALLGLGAPAVLGALYRRRRTASRA